MISSIFDFLLLTCLHVFSLITDLDSRGPPAPAAIESDWSMDSIDTHVYADQNPDPHGPGSLKRITLHMRSIFFLPLIGPNLFM